MLVIPAYYSSFRIVSLSHEAQYVALHILDFLGWSWRNSAPSAKRNRLRLKEGSHL